MMNEYDFTQQMIKFYHACQVPEDQVDQILTTNRDKIGTYLAATPELMARKFYEWTFDQPLD